jgi:GT2 family glycosyltransferase
MELAVVILNWNAAADTIRCVHDVASWEHLHPVIWVVDNHSTDGSGEIISRECPGVQLIRNRANLGFSGGNNRGIVQALSVSDAPILLLNNDAFVEEQDVIRLMDTLQADGRLGVVGPLLFDANQKDRLLSAGGRDIGRHVNTHICEITTDDSVHQVDYVPGTVVVVRAELFRTVGLFDEDYFFAGEVADLCERARQHGYVSAIDARARAFHSVERSSDLRETLHAYYTFRNRFLFIRKFRHTQRVPLYSFWILYGLGASLKARLQGKSVKARVVRLALLDGVRRCFGGQNERVLSMNSSRASKAALLRR